MTKDTMHPTCRMCGEYIFAVDGCKGHGDEEVYVDGTGGDVCCADEFMEDNKNGVHQP